MDHIRHTQRRQRIRTNPEDVTDDAELSPSDRLRAYRSPRSASRRDQVCLDVVQPAEKQSRLGVRGAVPVPLFSRGRFITV